MERKVPSVFMEFQAQLGFLELKETAVLQDRLVQGVTPVGLDCLVGLARSDRKDRLVKTVLWELLVRLVFLDQLVRPELQVTSVLLDRRGLREPSVLLEYKDIKETLDLQDPTDLLVLQDQLVCKVGQVLQDR